MFFELSDGTMINLNHITDIPVTMKSYAAVCITMSNGTTHRISKENADKIRAHVRSIVTTPS